VVLCGGIVGCCCVFEVFVCWLFEGCWYGVVVGIGCVFDVFEVFCFGEFEFEYLVGVVDI